MKHIGIVACSSEGAALCYRLICLESQKVLGEYFHPEITMHTHPFNKYVELIRAGDWKGVAELMLSSTKKLKLVGADFVICPDNTIHIAFEMVERASPLPWLHIAEEVARKAKEEGYKCLGILGTKYLMKSKVYPEKLDKFGINYLLPSDTEMDEINRIIFEELVKGIIKVESRKLLVKTIKNLQKQGCDAVVLGCTELPLIITKDVSPLPTLDSTKILAISALNTAISDPKNL